MRIKEIINWLQKRKYEDYGIKTDINPALTFFGIITFSLARIKVDPNPDKWSEKEKQIIADILETELKISLDRFNKCLKEEISKIKKEQLGLILNQIADKLTEKPIISLEEFIKRTEIEKILEYKKFIGRKEDIKELYSFLQDDRKIMVITGEGGSGKTRLALEFAKLVQNKNWQVYFINPYKSFQYLGINSSKRSVLLILDNASRYIDRDKVIEFVLNHTLDIDLKLLLLDRSIFKDDIESKLTQRYQFDKSYQIKNGDIVAFLKEYFGIEKENAVKIEESCRNSFVWATFYAEDFKNSGKISELKDILRARTEIYIEDIAVETDLKMKDVKRAIYILSLLTPISWNEDKKYFENILFSDEYKCLEKIISTASWGKIDILNTTNSNRECSIEPDPVADFLRFEFTKKDRFSVLLKELLPYMTFRLIYNIFVIPRYIKAIEEWNNLLGDIWKEINLMKGQNPEYFSALILFTGDLSILPFFDIKEANIKQWILCYKELIKNYSEKEVEIREDFGIALINAIYAYGRTNDLTKMEDCLKELRDFHEKYEEKEVRKNLASGLYNATHYYRLANDITKMEDCLKELRDLHEKYEEKEFRIKFIRAFADAANAYVLANDITKMEDCLKELRDFHEKYEEKEVREEFTTRLGNATYYHGKASEITKMEDCLKELRDLHDKYEEKEIREKLASGLYNAAIACRMANEFAKMEDCLKELKGLHDKYEEKEIREDLASRLHNAVSAYGKAKDLTKMEDCLKELRDLHVKYEEKEIREDLTCSLYNAANTCRMANEFAKMEDCLKELKGLHVKYEEKEIREKLVDGLVNAVSAYKMTNEFTKMEDCLKELRGFYEKYGEKEIREYLAKALLTEIYAYGKANDLTKMEDCLKELRGFYEKYGEKEIREYLAGGLLLSSKYFKDAKNNYRNFCLLYKLRFNMPLDLNKEEIIKQIEDLFINASKELIKNINIKDEKSLIKFANLIKGVVKNQDELKFLLNKIFENIDIKKKRKLLEISVL